MFDDYDPYARQRRIEKTAKKAKQANDRSHLGFEVTEEEAGRAWSYGFGSMNAIEYDEIRKELSPENPVAIMELSWDSDTCCNENGCAERRKVWHIVVWPPLFRKAQELGEVDKKHPGIFKFSGRKCVGKFLGRLKTVQNAPWPSKCSAGRMKVNLVGSDFSLKK